MILSHLQFDKEKYVSKSKADALKSYIIKPNATVLRKKIVNINETVRKMALNRSK